MNKLSYQTRLEALRILKRLCQRLRSVSADIFYDSLYQKGFSEDERTRLTGPCMRTASSRGWITKTECSIRSKRNHSNLQTAWLSNIFKQGERGQKIPDEVIEQEYELWKSRGHIVPDALVDAWRRVMEAAKLYPEFRT